MQTITESEKELLNLLLQNSRTSIANLGEQIGKGRNWVARTIRKLVTSKIIRTYVTVLDPAQVYAERNTILLIKTNPRELGVSTALLKMQELESLDGISGDHSLLGLFRFRSPGEFERFLDDVDRIVAKSGAQTYNLVQVLKTYKTNGFVLGCENRTAPPLTQKDWELLKVIRRQKTTEETPYPLSQDQIAKKMRPKLTQPAVSKALRRLENRGVIVGFSADISFGHVGLPIKFFLQIRPKPGRVAEAATKISEMNEVWNLHRVSEDFGLFATVRTPSVQSYNSFIRSLYKNEDVLDTYSQISLEEWFLP